MFGARFAALASALAVVTAACAPASSPAPTAPPARPTLVASPAARPAAAPSPLAAGADAGQEGKQLIVQKGCGGCHVIPGVAGATGTLGPDLAGVASRPTIAGGAVNNTGPDDLKRWIMDPPALKPGTAMPKLGLTDDEATKIVGYLETLK